MIILQKLDYYTFYFLTNRQPKTTSGSMYSHRNNNYYLNLEFNRPSMHFHSRNGDGQGHQSACSVIIKLCFGTVNSALEWSLRTIDSESPTSSYLECNCRSGGLVDFTRLHSTTGVKHIKQTNGGKGNVLRNVL